MDPEVQELLNRAQEVSAAAALSVNEWMPSYAKAVCCLMSSQNSGSATSGSEKWFRGKGDNRYTRVASGSMSSSGTASAWCRFDRVRFAGNNLTASEWVLTVGKRRGGVIPSVWRRRSDPLCPSGPPPNLERHSDRRLLCPRLQCAISCLGASEIAVLQNHY